MNSGMKECDRSSVCMAAYNGERFIRKQLESILAQIGSNDEVIIIDDGSSDSTPDIVRQMAASDPRVKLIINEKNLGVNATFEKAIRLASGKYIFLSDQDDIWTDGRYQLMLGELASRNVLCVSGNFDFIDAEGKPLDLEIIKLDSKDSSAYTKNIIRIFTGKMCYFGCAMAFDCRLKDIILPFPEGLECHDLWIAMAANYMKSNVHLDDSVLLHRLHGKNVTDAHRALKAKLRSRKIMFSMLRTLKKRKLRLPDKELE